MGCTVEFFNKEIKEIQTKRLKTLVESCSNNQAEELAIGKQLDLLMTQSNFTSW